MTLLERLEAATGPDREINARIWWIADRNAAQTAFWNAAMGKPRDLPDDFDKLPAGLGRRALEIQASNFSGSIDAALSWMPEGYGYGIVSDCGTAPAVVSVGPKGGPMVTGKHPSPPLAICIAICKARRIG